MIRCDFCFAQMDPKDNWCYLTTGFVLPAMNGFAPYEDADRMWATCDPCADLIEADDIEALIVRGTEKDVMINRDSKEPLPIEFVRWWKRRFFTAFFEHRLPGRFKGQPTFDAESQQYPQYLELHQGK